MNHTKRMFAAVALAGVAFSAAVAAPAHAADSGAETGILDPEAPLALPAANHHGDAFTYHSPRVGNRNFVDHIVNSGIPLTH
ncbi:hypothetical protein ACIOD1_33125 [Streptomyces sp. NPDC088097]|uniref:hypothetical protein n=1 Tax=Streptomyces sp. NPDC088097 TaxID=3365823 RepID=UPI0038277EE8